MTNDLIVRASFNNTVTLLDLSHLAGGLTLDPNSTPPARRFRTPAGSATISLPRLQLPLPSSLTHPANRDFACMSADR